MTTTSVVRQCRSAFILLMLVLLPACTHYSFQAMTVRDALLADRADVAFSLIEKQPVFSDAVLKNMNKGMLQRMLSDFAGSNASFEEAKKRIEKLYGISVTEQLGSVAINDAVIAYEGARFEQLLLHAYKAMNYIELDDLDSARVEMLQADIKMREWGEQPDDDPFIRYFAGTIYEALEEDDQAIVAYRHAIEAYIANRGRQPVAVPGYLVSDLSRLLKQEGLDDEAEKLADDFPEVKVSYPEDLSVDGELVVLFSHGLAPIKREQSITTYADEIEQTVRIALPAYLGEPAELHDVRLVIDGDSGMLETVEDIDALARAALEEEMPKILVRAIARAVVKHKSQQNQRGNQSMGGFLLTMTNLLTERADTRSWSTLPQVIQMSRHWLSAGEHEVEIEVVNRDGFVVDRLSEQVTIRAGKISYLMKHWVSPRSGASEVIPGQEDKREKQLTLQTSGEK